MRFIHFTILLLLFSSSLSAQWLTGWNQRQRIAIQENSGNALNSYQIRIDLLYQTGMDPQFNDLRFTTQDGTTLIDFWIETFQNASGAVVWLELPNLAANGSTDIYAYYDNPSASSASNGPATFIFFDDFSSFSGWNSISGGQIQQDATTFAPNLVLRKTAACDPQGGWKSIGSSLNNYRFIGREIRASNFPDCAWNRYGLENASFNGYSLRRNADVTGSSEFGIERRNAGTASNATGTRLRQPRGVWYRTEIRRDCSTGRIQAELFNDDKVSIGLEDRIDNTYCGVDRIALRGGRDYFFDYMAVGQFIELEPSYTLEETLLSEDQLRFFRWEEEQLIWAFSSLDEMANLQLEISPNGIDFSPLAQWDGPDFPQQFSPNVQGERYFRLAWQSRNGQWYYSPILVQQKAELAWGNIQCWPNPSPANISIQAAWPAGRYRLKLYNNLGQLLQQNKLELSQNQRLQYDLSPWPAGQYRLLIEGENGVYQLLPVVKL